MNDDERALCTATARWLQACGACVGALGLGAAAGAALALWWPGPAALSLASALGCAGALLLAVPERVLALRLRFDAGLFADLAEAWVSTAASPAATLASLDRALGALGLRRTAPRPSAPRGLASRVGGARRLSLQHAAVVLAQAALLAVALADHWATHRAASGW